MSKNNRMASSSVNIFLSDLGLFLALNLTKSCSVKLEKLVTTSVLLLYLWKVFLLFISAFQLILPVLDFTNKF